MEEEKSVVAIVLDGKVEELFECDFKMASLLLSNPIIIDVTNRKHLINSTGILYDDKTDLFYKRVDLDNQERPGLRIWPPIPEQKYDHQMAKITNNAIISNVNSVQEHIPATLNINESKGCGCGKN